MQEEHIVEAVEDAGFGAELMNVSGANGAHGVGALLGGNGLAKCTLSVSGLVFLSSATELEAAIQVLLMLRIR